MLFRSRRRRQNTGRGRACREVKRLWSECKTRHGGRFAVKQESRRFQRWECQCLQRMLRHHLPFPRVGEITVGQDLLLAMLHATRKRSRSSCMKRTGRSEAAKWPPFFRSLPPLRRAFGRRLLQRRTPQPTSGQAGPRRRSCRASSTTCTAGSGGNPLASPPRSPDGRVE